MRKIIVAGNWKMNHTYSEATTFVKSLLANVKNVDDSKVEMLIAPTSIYLTELLALSKSSNLLIGSQDVSSHNNGAFTGEISAEMLKSISVDFSIIGHSERRSYHNESNEMINTKLKKLIEQGIRPIVCIGETLEQREANVTKQVIIEQLKGCFIDIDLSNNHDIVIAYEPVWAIGTGKTASPEQAEEVHSIIRNWIKDSYSMETAEQIHILYGGSVKPANIAELLAQPNIDGGLIGGASLKVDSYTEMVIIAEKL